MSGKFHERARAVLGREGNRRQTNICENFQEFIEFRVPQGGRPNRSFHRRERARMFRSAQRWSNQLYQRNTFRLFAIRKGLAKRSSRRSHRAAAISNGPETVRVRCECNRFSTFDNWTRGKYIERLLLFFSVLPIWSQWNGLDADLCGESTWKVSRIDAS